MNYDSALEGAMVAACLPLIEKIIHPLRFLPWEDLRSIAALSALSAIRSEGAEGRAPEEWIRERIVEDLNEERRRLREQGWSRYRTLSLDRRVSDGGGATFLDWVRSPDRVEHIVLSREFQRSLSAEEREAAECLAYDCPLRDAGIGCEREAFVRNRIREKWIAIFGEGEA